MNTTFELIKNRRSIRRFSEEAVSREELEQIVEAGRWAPTGGNSQSVHFTVITNSEILARLRETVQNAFAAMELTEDLYASIQNSIKASKRGKYAYDYKAPVLVIVSNKRGYGNAMADCACAQQNMMLAAAEIGVGSCWINQLHWLDENEEVRKILSSLGIGEDETVCGSLALGKGGRAMRGLPRSGMPVTWVE